MSTSHLWIHAVLDLGVIPAVVIGKTRIIFCERMCPGRRDVHQGDDRTIHFFLQLNTRSAKYKFGGHGKLFRRPRVGYAGKDILGCGVSRIDSGRRLIPQRSRASTASQQGDGDDAAKISFHGDFFPLIARS